MTLQEGARQTVELALSAATSTPRSSSSKEERRSAPVVADASPAKGGGSAQRTWGFVTLGAGAVIAGVGTGFLVSSLNADAEADQLHACNEPPTFCSDLQQRQIRDKEAEVKKSRAIAVTGYVIGGAAMVTGLVLVVTADSDEDEHQAKRPARELRLIAGPGWLGASGTF